MASIYQCPLRIDIPKQLPVAMRSLIFVVTSDWWLETQASKPYGEERIQGGESARYRKTAITADHETSMRKGSTCRSRANGAQPRGGLGIPKNLVLGVLNNKRRSISLPFGQRFDVFFNFFHIFSPSISAVKRAAAKGANPFITFLL